MFEFIKILIRTGNFLSLALNLHGQQQVSIADLRFVLEKQWKCKNENVV